MMIGSKPSIGADSLMSRASPWGRPSMMSIITTSSARPFCTIRIAAVAPTNPLPTTVTRNSIASNARGNAQEESYGFSADRLTNCGLRGGGDRAVDGAQPGLLEHQQEVVWLGRSVERVVDRDEVLPDHPEQGLVERLHPVVIALGDDLVDLRRPGGVHDAVGDAAVVDHHLDRRDTPAAGLWNEPHADDPPDHA